MPLINGIEIDVKPYAPDKIRTAILNNTPIEENIHVIAVISNPCNYARRYILAKEFINRMELEENVILYVVELTYGNQEYYLTDKNNKRHLQLNAQVPLWHKENMINIAIEKLLPPTWKAVAWIDADIEFENPHWALDALKVLNGTQDVIQLFSRVIDLDWENKPLTIRPSYGSMKEEQKIINKNNLNKGEIVLKEIFKSVYIRREDIESGGHTDKEISGMHSGYAWACSRIAYEKMGKLFEIAITGSGDKYMADIFIGKNINTIKNINTEFRKELSDFQKKAKGMKLGYIPGIIKHNYHGKKEKRKYCERHMILFSNNYSPSNHIIRNEDGVLIPTETCPPEIISGIFKYLSQRNEDEGLKK